MVGLGLGLGVSAIFAPEHDPGTSRLIVSGDDTTGSAALGASGAAEAVAEDVKGQQNLGADLASVPPGGLVTGDAGAAPPADESTTTTNPAAKLAGKGRGSSAATQPDLQTTTTMATLSTGERPPPGPIGLSAVEREIYRLTNELRANPAGPLAREKPMPNCINDSFYGIAFDPAAGHPQAAPALALNESVSLSLARPWAIEMDRQDMFQHRSSSSALATYGDLGIGVNATGENIARSTGYPEAEAAMIHFVGWRESDDGHYCALVSPTYTHIGVGHRRRDSSSWAVQNFYRVR